MRGRIESLLTPLLHTGGANMRAVAGQLGLSRQSLFRKLRAGVFRAGQLQARDRCRQSNVCDPEGGRVYDPATQPGVASFQAGGSSASHHFRRAALMLPPRTTIQFVSLSLTVALVAGSAAGAGNQWGPIMLERVAVGISNIVPGPGGRGEVAVPISSKSADPVRVALRLRPPAPAPESAARMTLGAHRDTVVAWPQDAFSADADYVISVAVFADSSERDTLESGSTSARLTKKDVKALEEWLRESTLPRTFKHIEKVDKVTAGTSLSSMFGAPHGDGSLTVDSTGITYTTKKESIVIPASALRDVRLNESDPRQPWVVVAYEQAGESKSVSFKPSVSRGDASAGQMAKAIRAAMLFPPAGK